MFQLPPSSNVLYAQQLKIFTFTRFQHFQFLDQIESKLIYWERRQHIINKLPAPFKQFHKSSCHMYCRSIHKSIHRVHSSPQLQGLKDNCAEYQKSSVHFLVINSVKINFCSPPFPLGIKCRQKSDSSMLQLIPNRV